MTKASLKPSTSPFFIPKRGCDVARHEAVTVSRNNNIVTSFFFLHLLLLAISSIKKKKKGEDVTILLLRDTVTASWRATSQPRFGIKKGLVEPPS